MAAAALSRSRGVAGGLYFLFTLLCLVCLTTSLADNDKLENIKENLQKVQQNLDKVKAQRDTLSEIMSVYIRSVDQMMPLWKTISEESDDFQPLVGFLENMKGLVEKTKTYVDEQNVETDAKIADTEQKLGQMKKLLKALEEYHVEL